MIPSPVRPLHDSAVAWGDNGKIEKIEMSQGLLLPITVFQNGRASSMDLVISCFTHRIKSKTMIPSPGRPLHDSAVGWDDNGKIEKIEKGQGLLLPITVFQNRRASSMDLVMSCFTHKV